MWQDPVLQLSISTSQQFGGTGDIVRVENIMYNKSIQQSKLQIWGIFLIKCNI